MTSSFVGLRRPVWGRGGVALVAGLVMLFAAAALSDGAEAATKRLAVHWNGTTGTVTSSPAGINCASPTDPACEAEFDEGETVTLTAGGASSYLVGWNGACQGALPECEVRMDRNREVWANFRNQTLSPPDLLPKRLFVLPSGEGLGQVALNPYPLSPGSSDPCASADQACEYEYDAAGATVTLSAAADAGSVFTGWNGACQGLDSSCSVKLKPNELSRSVWASFSPEQAGLWPLTVHRTGNGYGRVTGALVGLDCGNDCSVQVAANETVTLNATPKPGSVFTGWNGACSGLHPVCTVKMNKVRSVWASFNREAIDQGGQTYYALAVHRTGNQAGTVISDPVNSSANDIDCGNDCVYSYFPAGQTVRLTATPDSGNTLAGWNGACIGTDPVCEVTMDGPKAVWAAFSQPRQFPGSFLTIIKVGSGQGHVNTTQPGVLGPEPGIDCGSDCYGQFSNGVPVPLTATPEPGSVFTGWNGACTGMGTCTVTMDQSKTVWASFARVDDPAYRTLTVFKTGDGNGNVISDPAGIECPAAGGICEASFTKDSTVTLTASPRTGSVFTGWNGACNGLNPVCTVKMSQVRSVWASFTLWDGTDPAMRPTLLVSNIGDGTGTVTSDPAGISCRPACDSKFDRGEVVTLTAAAAPGSVFMGWSGDCEGKAATCELTMDAPRAAWAMFASYDPDGSPPDSNPPLAVFRTGNGEGTVTSSPGQINCGDRCFERFNLNTEVTLTAVPADGSVFAGWSGDCDGLGACVVDMNGPRSAWARFVPDPGPGPSHVLTVTKSITGAGTVVSDPAGIDCGSTCSAAFAENVKVTLTATADSGSLFSGWSGACTGADASCEVTMDAAKTVTATFTKVDPGPAPKPPGPPDPKNGSTATFDPVTGLLKFRLKCTGRFRPRCLKMVAWAVTGKGRKARQMTQKRARVKNRRAGKWKLARVTVKPNFRKRVEKMAARNSKTLWVRIKVTGKKKVRVKVRRRGKVRWVKRRTVTIHHRYRVLVRR